MPRVEFSPEARADLLALHAYILKAGGAARAARFVDRIERHCLILQEWPLAGAPRDDVAPGVRLLAFDQRISILYRSLPDRVQVGRILYAGRQP